MVCGGDNNPAQPRPGFDEPRAQHYPLAAGGFRYCKRAKISIVSNYNVTHAFEGLMIRDKISLKTLKTEFQRIIL
jgi:hypothetical protein